MPAAPFKSSDFFKHKDDFVPIFSFCSYLCPERYGLRMKKLFLMLIWLFSGLPFSFAESRTDSLLRQLDRAVKERSVYGQEREARIGKLTELLGHTTSAEQRYDIYDKLFSEYHLYNTDSALFVSREKWRIAEKLNSPDKREEARMNMAETMGTTGMFKEALDLLNSVTVDLPIGLRTYKYHIYRTVYGLLSDYAVTSRSKEEYDRLTENYRDSLLTVLEPGSSAYLLVEADRMNIRGQVDEAIGLMAGYYGKHAEDIHTNAVVTYTLSESYRLKGNKVKEEEYLVLSSIADLQSAVREYISLRKVALLLYQAGDIDRAYAYLQCCMEDAILCNARLRLLEILKIFPIVNQAYEVKAMKQQAVMKTSLVLISILSVCLIIAIFYVYRQIKKLTVARREVVEANKRLKDLNLELALSNTLLKDVNHALTEASQIKEEYIARYMDQCSAYIDKIDAYRRSLGKIAAAGKVDDLFRTIKSTRFIEDELEEFYANFDNTFLHLFPSFVEDFNRLLVENERIRLKPGERMNTELRIFALIRLGIADSTKIARFLRYSVTTIYNYRTKTRNKAAGDRDDFEKKVMKIGK